MSRDSDAADRFLHEVAIGAQSTLGIDDFLREAWKYNQRPPTSGKWRTRMWSFVRLAKGHPALQNLTPAAALDAVHAVIDVWERPADRPDAWAHWFPGDDPQMEFWDAWEKVHAPVGAGDLAAALVNADRSPFYPLISPSPGYCRFVSVAAWLQIGAGQGQIFLPVEKIGFVLGMSARTVSIYRQAAIRAGLLRLREKGRYREHRADEFYFHLELFDRLTGQQLGEQPPDFNQESQEQHTHQEKQDIHEPQTQQEYQSAQNDQDHQDLQEFNDSQRETGGARITRLSKIVSG